MCWCQRFYGEVSPLSLIELTSEMQLYTSRALLDELVEVLQRRKFTRPMQACGFTANQLASHYRRLAYRVTIRQLTQRVSRDADDDQVLACALAAKADLIVSGDRDLLTLKVFRNIPMVTAAEAVLLATK